LEFLIEQIPPENRELDEIYILERAMKIRAWFWRISKKFLIKTKKLQEELI